MNLTSSSVLKTNAYAFRASKHNAYKLSKFIGFMCDAKTRVFSHKTATRIALPLPPLDSLGRI